MIEPQRTRPRVKFKRERHERCRVSLTGRDCKLKGCLSLPLRQWKLEFAHFAES